MTAHDLTSKAFREKTSAAHLEAAEAHEREAWNFKLGQFARGNHMGQAEKHRQIYRALKQAGK